MRGLSFIRGILRYEPHPRLREYFAIVQRILKPARTVPEKVPAIFDTPIRLLYDTGTSTIVSPRRIALTCISHVQPKVRSTISSLWRASHRTARNGPRSV